MSDDGQFVGDVLSEKVRLLTTDSSEGILQLI